MSTDNNKEENISEQIESAKTEREDVEEEEELEESASSSALKQKSEKADSEKSDGAVKQESDERPDISFQEMPKEAVKEEEEPARSCDGNDKQAEEDADQSEKSEDSSTDESSKAEEVEAPLKETEKKEADEEESFDDLQRHLAENVIASSVAIHNDIHPDAAEEKKQEPDVGLNGDDSADSDSVVETDNDYENADENAQNDFPDESDEEDAEESEESEEDKKSAFKKFIMTSWKRVLRDCVVVLLIVAFVYCYFCYHYGIWNESDSSTGDEVVTIVETETETETEKMTEAAAKAVETEPVQPETVIQYVEVEAEPVETENWKDTIFGEESSSLLPNITVTGITSVQKDRTGFRETDFLQALSDFLGDNNITGITQVNFEEEIMCSSDGASAFRATLIGRPDKVLNVILYPDYPGRYILTLQDAQEVTVEVQTQAQTESSNQSSQYQYVYPSQDSGTTESQQQAVESGTRDYDATTLSVIGIPETLGNYLSNQYELQYTLYDYIYRNGYDADVAVVSDYYIDYDNRQAIIYFTLSDARMVTGTYSKDTNSYSYN